MPLIKRRELAPFDGGSDIQSPLLQRIYGARGLHNAKELPRKLNQLPNPTSLKGISEALVLLEQAFSGQQSLLIVGDFDADGATSSALMVLALRRMGLVQVDFLVPNRFDYGYGLTPEIVEQAMMYRPDIIITVDNGIASHEGIALARANGVMVIVTDHHLPGDTLPNANAIINPNQHGCEFPSKAIAGVGVAFFLLLALRAHLRELGWFTEQGINEPNLAEYLDLVALGTVADVVPLDAVNRILVHQGLLRIRAGKCRFGIKALLTIAKRDFMHITASDLGFAIGPRLNAAGRLDDMAVGIGCLLADDPAEAHLVAVELDSLNADRRLIEQGMQHEAEQVINTIDAPAGELPAGLCLYKDGWHQGVVGIVASRIKERHYRPVIAFAKAEDGSLKGSARSIAGVHIRDVLALIAAENPQLLQKFGGHAMAAGLSLAAADLPAFTQLFAATIKRLYSNDVFANELLTDGELDGDDYGIDTAQLLETAGPWGQGFPEPCFENTFAVVSQRLLVEKHLKLKVRPVDGAQELDAIAFNIDPVLWPNSAIKQVRLVYRLSINRFRGAQTPQLMIDHIEAVE